MGYKVEFAGIKLHEIVNIERVSTSILPSRDNFTRVIPINNGSFYNGFRYEEKVITVSIGLPTKTRKDFNDIISKLSFALNVSSPSRLCVDESDIVHYAVINGETDVNKLFKTGKVDLNFICHDPLGYSKSYTSISMDNMNTFRFSNMGTYNSYPVLGFTFREVSSFIYLANEKGESLMVGSQKNSTVRSVQATDRLVDDDCSDSSKFTNGGNITVSDNRVVAGNYGVGNNGLSMVATSYGNDVPKKWTGPTFRRNIGRNLDQFEVRVNFSFSSQGKNFDPINPHDLVRVTRKSGTYLYQNNDYNSTVLTTIPYETDLNILEMSPSSACRVNYNGQMGWVNTKYVSRINIKNRQPLNESRDLEYAEDQMGLMEAIGLDSNGNILFRFHIRDDSEFFEHVKPEVYIRDRIYLQSSYTIPTPNTISEKDDEGKPMGEKPIASGVFGTWNDYTGTFSIRRKKIENGQYRWWAKISRTDDGVNTTQEIHMGPGVVDSSLPTGKLNNIVFYISKYDGAKPVSVMAVNHIGVMDITNEEGDGSNPDEDVNVDIFKPTDYLEIDFENCNVTLNGENFMNKLDIGSQFFNVEKNSRILVKSDDKSIVGGGCYRKRYI